MKCLYVKLKNDEHSLFGLVVLTDDDLAKVDKYFVKEGYPGVVIPLKFIVTTIMNGPLETIDRHSFSGVMPHDMTPSQVNNVETVNYHSNKVRQLARLRYDQARKGLFLEYYSKGTSTVLSTMFEFGVLFDELEHPGPELVTYHRGGFYHDAFRDPAHRHGNSILPPQGSVWDLFESEKYGIDPEREDDPEPELEALFGTLPYDNDAAVIAWRLLQNLQENRVSAMAQIHQLICEIENGNHGVISVATRLEAIMNNNGFFSGSPPQQGEDANE